MTTGSIFFQLPADQGGLRLAIGIDFGATSTGAYVKFGGSASHRPDMIIGNWPGHVGGRLMGEYHKIPTQLATDGLDNNAGRPVRWGLLVSDDEPSFRWFKLGLVHQDDYLEDDLGELHDDVHNSDELKKAVALRERYRASAVFLTTAYLKAIWNHVLKEVASRLKIPEDQVRQSELHVAIGTPANSKSGTVNLLRRAAKKAGIPGHRHPRSKLYVCAEPEAAAIALVEHRQISQDLTSGDIITVCDCGGGTMDAASFEVTSTQPFELVECVSGKARFGGPVVLDGIFKTSLQERLTQAAAKTSSVTAVDIRHLYSELWEFRIKPYFDGSDEPSEWVEPVPPHLAVRRGNRPHLRSGDKPEAVGFTRDELMAYLDPTTNKAMGLIRHQVKAVLHRCNKLPKSVIICGGFGENLYLKAKLEEEIQRLNSDPGFEMDRPMDLEFASSMYSRMVVSMGCVTHAFNKGDCQGSIQPTQPSVYVASRIAQLSYGIVSGRTPSPRQLITQGTSLSLINPQRHILQDVDFALQGDGGVAVHIYEANDVTIKTDTMVKICSLTWNAHGTARIAAALQGAIPIELAVDCAGKNVHFTVYIDGILQSPGAEETGFDVEFDMAEAP